MATTRRQFLRGSAAAGVAGLAIGVSPSAGAAEADEIRSHPDAFTVALIGDFGSGRPGQRDVARMVHGWKPTTVFTMGDNVYSADGVDPQELIDTKVGDYYGKFIANQTFFPSIGNHDWGDPGTAIIEVDGNGGTRGAWHDTFDYLPGNGRYYDVRLGPLHVFVVDDYFREPDGHRLGSKQAQWLEASTRASDAEYKVVVHHFAPYVSSVNANKQMRWPFDQWGIDASFTGHWHHYERREVDGVQYIVNGLGGTAFGFSGTQESGVEVLYAAKNGASRMTFSPDAVLVEFLSSDGVIRDSHIHRFADHNVPVIPPVEPVQPEPTKPEPEGSGPLAGEPFVAATGRAATIARLYFAVFERAPDLDGFDYWSNLALPVTRVAEFFVSSTEFLNTYGSLGNTDFVDRVYRNVLGRSADSDGFAYWAGLLDKGTTRGDVMIGFSESPEFRTRTGIER